MFNRNVLILTLLLAGVVGAVVAFFAGLAIGAAVLFWAIGLISVLAIPERSVLGVATTVALVLLTFSAGFVSVGVDLAYTMPLITGVLIIALCRSWTRLSVMAPAVWLLALLGLTTAVTLVQPYYDWYYLAVSGTTAVLVVVVFSLSSSERVFVGRAIIWFALILSVLALVETFVLKGLLFGVVHTGLSRHSFLGDAIRAEAFTSQPLILGFMLVVAFLVVWQSPDPLLHKVAFSTAYFAAIIATGSLSMALILVAVAGMKVFLRCNWVGRLIIIALALALVLAAFLLNLVPWSSLEALFGSKSDHRRSTAGSVINILEGQPPLNSVFGNGWNSGGPLFDSGLFDPSTFHAIDNQIVSTFVDSGVVGVLLLLAFLVSVMRRLPKQSLINMLPIMLSFFVFDLLLLAVPSLLFVYLASEAKPGIHRIEVFRFVPVAQRGKIR